MPIFTAPMQGLSRSVAAFLFACFPFGEVALGQQADPVEVNISDLKLYVPRAFVALWLPNRRVLRVDFGYPGLEPLGFWRFDGDKERALSYEQSVLKRGTRIISVELSEIRNDRFLKMAPDEKYRLLESLCESSKVSIERSTRLEVNFIECFENGRSFLHLGYSPQYQMTFKLEPRAQAWRLSRADKKKRILLVLNLGHDDLSNWKSIVGLADELVVSWQR
jgi:hypothetical protein